MKEGGGRMRVLAANNDYVRSGSNLKTKLIKNNHLSLPGVVPLQFLPFCQNITSISLYGAWPR